MKTSKACVVTSRNSLWKQWNTMCQHVAHRLSTYIPGWPPWMLRRLSNRKHKVHTRAKHSNDTKEKKRFKALKRQLQRESRRTHKAYLEDIVCDDLRTNPKRFWSYMKTRKQDSSQIVTLRSKDGFLYSDTAIKTAILNEQFQSLYTREDLSALSDLGPSPYPTMSNITIHEREYWGCTHSKQQDQTIFQHSS